jgi:hypothetical protein
LGHDAVVFWSPFYVSIYTRIEWLKECVNSKSLAEKQSFLHLMPILNFRLVLEKQEKFDGHQQFFAIVQLIGTRKQAENFAYR